MIEEIWYLIPAAGALVGAGLLPLVSLLGRRPCPHCGRRAGRRVLDDCAGPAIPAVRTITYACRACGGAMRYARRPTGQEFWEPIAATADEGS